MIDVYDKITDRMAGPLSIHRYLGSSRWDTIVKQLTALPIAGTYAMQVGGRVDIASLEIYRDPMFDWVLLLYNHIRHIGSDEGYSVKKTATYATLSGETELLEAILTPGTYSVLYMDGTAQKEAALSQNIDGSTNVAFGGPPILLISYEYHTFIKNISGSEQSYVVAYPEIVYDDTLAPGTILNYPDALAVNKILAEESREVVNAVTGFARL
jgi:hypothetical protein